MALATEHTSEYSDKGGQFQHGDPTGIPPHVGSSRILRTSPSSRWDKHKFNPDPQQFFLSHLSLPPSHHTPSLPPPSSLLSSPFLFLCLTPTLSCTNIHKPSITSITLRELVVANTCTPRVKQEAQLMLTTGSTRLAVSRGQQTWYHSTCYM